MQVLIVGSGGREHALAWKLIQSPAVSQVYCAPGNAGIRAMPKCRILPLAPTDIEGLLRFATVQGIGLTVVGPELPLVQGICDQFQQARLPIFGPTQAAAQIEGSKAWAKQLLHQAGVPTARSESFKSLGPALSYLESQSYPVVIKVSGLASGKGVIIPQTPDQAKAAVEWALHHRPLHGEKQVVIEEYLQGEEVSIIALCDGQICRPLLPSQDHKRIGEGDTGPNTGGMGAYAPAHHLITPERMDTIQRRIFDPVLAALQTRGIEYRGVLYGGLMISPTGEPQVLEFNCRLGDPETQALLPLLETPLDQVLRACVEGRLEEVEIQWQPKAAACVVVTSQGYPESFERGKAISGLETAAETGALIFHGGTRLSSPTVHRSPSPQIVTDGGRVLGITGIGDTLAQALDQAYSAIGRIQFEGAYYRRDIGRRGLGPDLEEAPTAPSGSLPRTETPAEMPQSASIGSPEGSESMG